MIRLMLEYLEMSKIQNIAHLRSGLRRATTIHYFLTVIMAAQLVLYDTGKLIPPEVVLRRWIALALQAVVITVVWYISRNRSGQLSTLKKLVATLVVSDIAYASFSIYTQRGMASRAIILYVIPIVTAALLARRSAVLAAAALSVAAYVTTAIAYFVLNFNEGYKLELYGEVGFYAVIFVLISTLLWTVSRHEKS